MSLPRRPSLGHFRTSAREASRTALPRELARLLRPVRSDNPHSDWRGGRRYVQPTFPFRVKNGSVPARAACPFDPQEQTSSGYTLRSGSCRSRYFAKYSTLFDRPVDDVTAALIRVQSPRYRQDRRSTLPRRSSIMDIDRDHIDDAVPALLFLGASRRDAHLELLRLGRDGAAPYKGIDLGPSRQS
jgi:hypothetical protein